MYLPFYKFRRALKFSSKFKKYFSIGKCVDNCNVKLDFKNKHRVFKNYRKNVEIVRYQEPLLQLHREIRMYSSDSEKPKRLWHKDTEQAVNDQIGEEFKAMFTYLSMACYFDRSEVALPGSYAFFMNMHEEEHGHALEFINYQNLRGGKVILKNTEIDGCKEWTLQTAFETALSLEKAITNKLVILNQLGEKHCDISLSNLITGVCIPEQMQSICQMTRIVSRLNKMGGDGVSQFLFDKELYRAFGKKDKKDKKWATSYILDNMTGRKKYI